MAEMVSFRVRMRDHGERYWLGVTGELVAPGLAVVAHHVKNEPIPGRWVLTHIASGRAISCLGMCREHVEVAAALAVESGVDWRRGRRELIAEPSATGAWNRILDAAGPCGGLCPQIAAEKAVA